MTDDYPTVRVVGCGGSASTQASFTSSHCSVRGRGNFVPDLVLIVVRRATVNFHWVPLVGTAESVVKTETLPRDGAGTGTFFPRVVLPVSADMADNRGAGLPRLGGQAEVVSTTRELELAVGELPLLETKRVSTPVTKASVTALLILSFGWRAWGTYTLAPEPSKPARQRESEAKGL